jgi:pimeloyl-ACP methyl ester carboxylesterase
LPTDSTFTQTIYCRGFSLFYQRQGEGKTCVFVHELGLGLWAWQDTADFLGEGMTSVCYDRRGYGRSYRPQAYEAYTIEEHTQDLACVVKDLASTPVTLCGHGLGAVVCIDLIGRYPQLVADAVLIEPHLFALSQHGSEKVSRLRSALVDNARLHRTETAVAAVIAELGGSALIDRLKTNVKLADLMQACANDLQAATRWQFGKHSLAQLKTPMTLLCGTQTDVVWSEISQELANTLPSAQISFVEGGHFLPLEASEDVARAIAAFTS